MEEREFVCIVCPLGCNITASLEGGIIQSVTGNTCPRGANYVTKELTDPRRMLTSLVRVRDGELPVVSVKTVSDIPKGMVRECAKALKEVELQAPVRLGDVVLRDICGSGVDVVATKTVECAVPAQKKRFGMED